MYQVPRRKLSGKVMVMLKVAAIKYIHRIMLPSSIIAKHHFAHTPMLILIFYKVYVKSVRILPQIKPANPVVFALSEQKKASHSWGH